MPVQRLDSDWAERQAWCWRQFSKLRVARNEVIACKEDPGQTTLRHVLVHCSHIFSFWTGTAGKVDEPRSAHDSAWFPCLSALLACRSSLNNLQSQLRRRMDGAERQILANVPATSRPSSDVIFEPSCQPSHRIHLWLVSYLAASGSHDVCVRCYGSIWIWLP